jgi:hypothetical protein
MKFIFFLFSLTISYFSLSQEYSKPPVFAQKVYDDIFNTMDNGKVNKPTLVLSNSPKEVATFDPTGKEPLIRIGVNFIELIRNFGKDSSNALAQVLGHELAHVILRQNDFISNIGSGYASAEFNKSVKQYKKTLQDSVFERQADEYAAFYAHISGYNTNDLGSVLLDSIYNRFNLTDAKLNNYPSLMERKSIAEFTENKMSGLKKLYDAANLFVLTGNFDLAASMYRTIIAENFPSREIHNNIGVINLMQGIQLLDTIEYPYYFPVTLDFDTRLKSNSERAISQDAELFLKESIRNFDNAIVNSKDYYPAYLNRAIANFILNNQDAYEIDLIYLKKCTDSNLIAKIEVLKLIDQLQKGQTSAQNELQKMCIGGNNLACKNIKANRNTNKIKQEPWTSKLAFIDSIQNPRFDFMVPEARFAGDSLGKLLSVTKRDIQFRRVIKNNIVGERWSYIKSNPSYMGAIYKIKSLPLSQCDKIILETNTNYITSFKENRYFSYGNLIIVINPENAIFYYIK